MASYRVTAPYVTLKVADQNGQSIVVGYYENAVVSDVDKDSLKSHLDRGYLEKVETPSEPAAKPAAHSRG